MYIICSSAAFAMQLEIISAFAMPWGLQIPILSSGALQMRQNQWRTNEVVSISQTALANL